MVSRYPGTCKKCNGRFTAGDNIYWQPGHVEHAQCPPALPKPSPVNVPGIASFVALAHARGIKSPRVRFLAPDGRTELRITLAGAQARHPNSLYIHLDRQYVGSIRPNGDVTGELANKAPIIAALQAAAVDPAAAALAYARFSCRCSFCGLELTDAGSVEVGYGPICAQHWGLPHVAKGTPVPALLADTDFVS